MTTNDYSTYYNPKANTQLPTESNDLTVDYEAGRPARNDKFNTTQTSTNFNKKRSSVKLNIVEDDIASDYDQKETDK